MNTSSILTVSRVTINLGIEIDAYSANKIDPATGKLINYLSGKGLVDSIGLTDKTTRPQALPKELKDLLGQDFTTIKGKYKNESGAYSKINLWTIEKAKKYYGYHALKGNKKAAKILGLMSDSCTISSIKLRTEKDIQDKLNMELNGEKEVCTPVGNIDILTMTELIEIKKTHSWKSALGQVLAYSHFYPSHKKRIHLFGKCHTLYKQDIQNICAKYDVKVTYE